MSRFTGKSDFADLVENAENIEDFYMFKDSYICMNNAEIRIDCKEDLYQFYPFCIASMSSSKENGRRRYAIQLAKEPYFDTRERESLSVYLLEYIDAVHDFKGKGSSEKIYNKWLEKKRDDLYDKDVMYKVFDRLNSLVNDNDRKDLADAFEKARSINVRFRNKILESIVDDQLFGIHLEACQKRRKDFVEWYDSVSNGYWSPIVNAVRYKLGTKLEDA